jgi:hypothetical protein
MKTFNFWGHLALCLLGSLWGTGLSLSAQIPDLPEYTFNSVAYGALRNNMGISTQGNPYINAPLGTDFQDVKRAVFNLVIVPENGTEPNTCTATLLNTVVQNGRPYGPAAN